MINKKEFMKLGYDRSFVFRDSQGRMITKESKMPKSKVSSSAKSSSKSMKSKSVKGGKHSIQIKKTIAIKKNGTKKSSRR